MSKKLINFLPLIQNFQKFPILTLSTTPLSPKISNLPLENHPETKPNFSGQCIPAKTLKVYTKITVFLTIILSVEKFDFTFRTLIINLIDFKIKSIHLTNKLHF